MDPNPYTPTETDKPIQAQLAYRQPVLQRLLAIAVPFCAGASAMSGVGCIAGGHWIPGAGFIGLALGMMLMAWSWTR